MLRAGRRADRVVVAGVAAFNAGATVVLAWDVHAGGLLAGPWWPALFGVAAVATFLFALWPRSEFLMASSGALCGTAYVSRAALVLVAMLRGQAGVTDARALLGMGVWLFVGFLTRCLWLYVLKPAAGDRRTRPRS